MSKIIEAKAIISGEDRLSGVLDKVNSKLRQVGKGAKISAEIDRLNKSLTATKTQLAAVGRVQAAQDKLSGAKLGLSGAQARADQIGRALDAAKKAGDARGVADLASQHKAAGKAVAQAASAVDRQAGAIRDARRALNEFGVPVANVAAHERALQQSVERTTAAIRGQERALRERERVAQAKDLRRQRRQEAIDAAADRIPARPVPARPGRPKAEKGGAERSLGPLAGVLGAAEAAGSYRQAAAFDRRLTLIGQTADAGRAEIEKMGGSLFDLAQETAVPIDKVTGGLESLVAQGRSLKEGLEFLPSVARTAAASGSEVEDIAKTADSVGTNFGIAGRQMQKAFDIMVAGGKAGQFELKDMARYLPSLAPAASAVGMKSEKGLADTVAMLQTIRKGTGTVEEAAASLNNIFQKMESEETTKKFSKMGVDLAAAMKKGREEGRNLIEVFEEAAAKATKGDLSKLPQLINDMEFARGVRALLTYRGEWQKLSQTLQQTSGRSVMRDIVQVTQDAQASLDRLESSWKRFYVAAAKAADTGGVSKGLTETARDLAEVAGALERVNKAYGEGGFFDALRQGFGDGAERLKENRKAWLDHYGETEDKRVKELEAAKEAHRRKLEGEGRSPAEIADAMAIRDAEIARARRRKAAVAKAREAPELADGKPLRMGVDPAPADREPMAPPPIRGETAPVYPGIPSFQEAFPLDVTGRKPLPEATPLPPRRPPELPAFYGRIEDVLNRKPGGAASPAQPPPAPPPARAVPVPPERPPEFAGRTIPVEVTKLPDRAAETFRPSIDGKGAAKAMPDGADPAAGFPTTVPASRGFWGDLLRGPTTRQQPLPGFGAGDKTIPVRVESLPADARLDATAARTEQRAMPDQRIEATVKPDQITARVTEIPPVTGSVEERVTHEHHHTITLNSDLLDAKIRSVTSQTVKSIPLASSGARPGAISMPGAAGNAGGR